MSMTADGDDETDLVETAVVDDSLPEPRFLSNTASFSSRVTTVASISCDQADDGACATAENTWLYPVICIAAATLVLILIAQLLFWTWRVRKQKSAGSSENPAAITRQRLDSISTISGSLPPRYSQIFCDQQDGASIFEEPAPDYETVQPDLVKTYSETLSRASSIRTWASSEAIHAEQSADGAAAKNEISDRHWAVAVGTQEEMVIDETVTENGTKIAEEAEKKYLAKTASTKPLLDDPERDGHMYGRIMAA